MTDRILYWTTVVTSSLALVLFVANVSVMSGNQDVRKVINDKQTVINTASQVLPLNQQLSQALYKASVDKKSKKDGGKIRELLIAQGFVLPAEEADSKKSNK